MENSIQNNITEELNKHAEEIIEEEIEPEQKKEIQVKISKEKNHLTEKATEEEFYSILKTVSPGTNLRTGIDGALKAGKGALIVVENEQTSALYDGGFRVNCRFTPQRLVELCKMDGATVLSKNLKRINYANVYLTPKSSMKTNETGARHKAAERTAKQTGTLVIAISERKNEITLFYKNLKHPLKSTEEILRKVNEQIQILEKQRDLFDKNLESLDKLELTNYPGLVKAVNTVKKGYIIQKIAHELRRYIIELGIEATLIKTRLKEIISGVEKETNLIIKDYTNLDVKKTKVLLESLSYEEILDSENILSALAYEKPIMKEPIKGWRLLSKTTLSDADIALLIKETGSLGKALYSGIGIYTNVLGHEKA